MDRQLERGCGLDVHKETIAACVRINDRRGRATHSVRHEIFSTRANLDAIHGSTIVLFALDNGLRVHGESLSAYDTAVIVTQNAVISAAKDRASALIVRIVDFRPNVL